MDPDTFATSENNYNTFQFQFSGKGKNRSTINLSTKLAIIAFAEKNNVYTQSQMASHFGIDRTTISKILKNKERIIENGIHHSIPQALPLRKKLTLSNAIKDLVSKTYGEYHYPDEKSIESMAGQLVKQFQPEMPNLKIEDVLAEVRCQNKKGNTQVLADDPESEHGLPSQSSGSKECSTLAPNIVVITPDEEAGSKAIKSEPVTLISQNTDIEDYTKYPTSDSILNSQTRKRKHSECGKSNEVSLNSTSNQDKKHKHNHKNSNVNQNVSDNIGSNLMTACAEDIVRHVMEKSQNQIFTSKSDISGEPQGRHDINELKKKSKKSDIINMPNKSGIEKINHENKDCLLSMNSKVVDLTINSHIKDENNAAVENSNLLDKLKRDIEETKLAVTRVENKLDIMMVMFQSGLHKIENFMEKLQQ